MLTRFFVRPFTTKLSVQQYCTKVKDGRSTPTEFLWKFIESSHIRSSKDWKNVRSEILKTRGPITPSNIDAMTVGTCILKKEFDLAANYIDFLKEENMNLNLATLGKYFKLLYLKNVDSDLSQNDEEKILSLYESVRKMYPVLDALTLENIIQALSITKQWKICIDLLKESKISTTPSSITYSVIIAAAFANNSDSVAWNLLREMIENDRPIQNVVYSSYFKKCAKNSNPSKEVEVIFNFMQKNNILLEYNYIDDFVESLKKIKKIRVNPSVIYQRAICKHCNNKLRMFELTEDEFTNLKRNMVENVIIGKDVFCKTTSEELERFKTFVFRTNEFDVVVDGLNVAYSVGVNQPPIVTSGLVAAVVQHFINLKKKVLVFGRNHMNRWPKKNWNYIQQNSTLFLAENLSQDDPYLLYTAMSCGKNTIIVTRDLMRSHKFLLKNFHLKCLFDRWLSQRQYSLLRVVDRGTPIFKNPLPYNHIAQKNGNCWHIPCTSPNKIPSNNTHWLCIRV